MCHKVHISDICQWKRISRKQSARWLHLSRLKARALFFKKNCQLYEMQHLILRIGYAIQQMMEPYWVPSKAGAEHEILLNKPAFQYCLLNKFLSFVAVLAFSKQFRSIWIFAAPKHSQPKLRQKPSPFLRLLIRPLSLIY